MQPVWLEGWRSTVCNFRNFDFVLLTLPNLDTLLHDFHDLGFLWCKAILKIYVMSHINGTVSQDCFAPVFTQSAHSGPIRDVLGQFGFLANFHRVIVLLKRLPGT